MPRQTDDIICHRPKIESRLKVPVRVEVEHRTFRQAEPMSIKTNTSSNTSSHTNLESVYRPKCNLKYIRLSFSYKTVKDTNTNTHSRTHHQYTHTHTNKHNTTNINWLKPSRKNSRHRYIGNYLKLQNNQDGNGDATPSTSSKLSKLTKLTLAAQKLHLNY